MYITIYSKFYLIDKNGECITCLTFAKSALCRGRLMDGFKIWKAAELFIGPTQLSIHTVAANEH